MKRVLSTLFGALPLIKDVIIIFVFFYTIMAIAGLALFSGTLKKRCYSESLGILTDTLCSGDSSCDTNFICGKGIANPN